MELNRIEIVNFRSIKCETISFSRNCLVLLGKNEAGKSNILKSIAAVFGQYNVTDRDKRKKIGNEKIEEYNVSAIMKLSKDDLRNLEIRFQKKFKGSENIVYKSGISFSQYLSKVFHELLISIDIGNNQKPILTYWDYADSDAELTKPLFINEKEITTSGYTAFNLESEIFSLLQEYYHEHPVKCHYWQYSDNFLLPNIVNLAKFRANPSSFKALENIFQLCGREDIETEFVNAISEDGDYSNLLEQVSHKITLTFQKIWKDFKGTSIQLLPNGEEILVKVADKAKYTFEDRSDGFKKFISILLMLSTPARANKILENDIVLIDEPDQSLYPTSAQYLRDELIEISKKSKVVYSTHSQYMIDSNCLDRHIVVEKSDDITTTKVQDANAPYTTDELLRRAIGSSIFECLKSKNIIFEGYLDKELFAKHCKFHKKEKEFAEYGQVYLAGISGVETLTQVLSLASKKFLIVADSDQASKSKRIDFEKNYPHFKDSWLGYQDVIETVETMEDFLTKNHLQDQFIEHGFAEYIYDENKTAIKNIEKAVGNDKDKKQLIKNSLVNQLSKNSIKDDYGLFVQKLMEKIEAL